MARSKNGIASVSRPAARRSCPRCRPSAPRATASSLPQSARCAARASVRDSPSASRTSAVIVPIARSTSSLRSTSTCSPGDRRAGRAVGGDQRDHRRAADRRRRCLRASPADRGAGRPPARRRASARATGRVPSAAACCADALVGHDVEERRLRQVDGDRLAQRAVEVGIAVPLAMWLTSTELRSRARRATSRWRGRRARVPRSRPGGRRPPPRSATAATRSRGGSSAEQHGRVPRARRDRRSSSPAV